MESLWCRPVRDQGVLAADEEVSAAIVADRQSCREGKAPSRLLSSFAVVDETSRWTSQGRISSPVVVVVAADEGPPDDVVDEGGTRLLPALRAAATPVAAAVIMTKRRRTYCAVQCPAARMLHRPLRNGSRIEFGSRRVAGRSRFIRRRCSSTRCFRDIV